MYVATDSNGTGSPKLLGIGPEAPVGDRVGVASAQPMLVTAQDVAKLLSISTRTLWRLRSAGVVPPPIHVGATVRWRLGDIMNWIADGCPPLSARENDPRRK